MTSRVRRAVYALQRCFGRGTVDSINHYFARSYAAVGVDKGVDLGICGIVNRLAAMLTAGEHGLYDTPGARTTQDSR